MKSLKRSEQKERTRKKLFDTALTLFLEKGYDNVTVDYIVSEAGVTKGAFYHHFLSKEAILIEYNNKVLESLIEELLLVIYSNSSKTSLEILERVFDCIIDFYLDNYSMIAIMVRESEKANVSVEQILKNEVANIIENVLDRGNKEKEYKLFTSSKKASIYITILLSEEIKSINKYELIVDKKNKISKEFRDLLYVVLNGIFIK